MPKQINTPTIGQQLVKALGLKGRFQPVLDEVVVPTINVAIDEQVERFPYWRGISQAGVAAEYTTAYLENPNGSKMIVEVDFFAYAMTNTSNILFSMAPLYTVGSTPGTSVKGYGRSAEANLRISAANLVYGTSSALNTQGWRILGGSTRPSLVNPFPLVVLSPGMGLQAVLETANITCGLGFAWYEYPANVTNA